MNVNPIGSGFGAFSMGMLGVGLILWLIPLVLGIIGFIALMRIWHHTRRSADALEQIARQQQMAHSSSARQATDPEE